MKFFTPFAIWCCFRFEAKDVLGTVVGRYASVSKNAYSLLFWITFELYVFKNYTGLLCIEKFDYTLSGLLRTPHHLLLKSVTFFPLHYIIMHFTRKSCSNRRWDEEGFG